MKTLLIPIGRIISVFIIILGVIHVAATFSPIIQGGLGCLNSATHKAMTYMSIICGSAFILSGLLIFLQIKMYAQLKASLLLLGIFSALSGILAVVYMTSNPFAWTALVLGLIAFFILFALLYYKT